MTLISCDAITDMGLEIVSSRCTNLRELSFRACNRITDKAIASLGKCKDLQELSIVDCDGITGSDCSHRALAELAAGCEHLG